MQLPEAILQLWQRLDQRGRLIVAGAAVLCVVGILTLTRLQSSTTYVALYTGLAPQDAGQIMEKLKNDKTSYRLTNGGTVIQVPEAKVYETRISLAKEGLPASGQVGFEIFDRSGLPGTQFSNRVNYQRALQGELARTIGAMEEISSARVHLVLPEENLFSEKTQASASVVLTPKPGAEVTREMTAAIAHIVASAVQEIKAEAVTVVDNSGRVLRSSEGSDGRLAGLTSGQLELQQQYEDRLCTRLQSMLDTVLGPNLSVVRVKAQLDFDSEEVKSENVMPVAGGKGIVTNEKVREEQYRGSSANGGTMGVQPNLGLSATGTASGQNGQYVNRDENRVYEFSRNSSSLVKAPGKVKSLTVATIIDDSLSPAAELQVQEILKAAAGVDPRRGDQVTVQRMKVDAAVLAKNQEQEAVAGQKAEQRQRLLQMLLRGGLSLIAAGLICASLFMAVRQLRPPPAVVHEELVSAPVPAPLPEDVFPTTEGSAEPQSQSEPEMETEPITSSRLLPVSEELNATIREQLREIARDDSSAVADRILALLQENSS